MCVKVKFKTLYVYVVLPLAGSDNGVKIRFNLNGAGGEQIPDVKIVVKFRCKVEVLPIKPIILPQKHHMEFIDPKLDDYVCSHTDEESALLQDLNRRTHLKILNPRMLSGQFQGRLLAMISHMIRPERILEIGTYTGYSALCFAEGLAADGKITTIDINEELEDFVRGYIAEAGMEDRIEYVLGDAMQLIPAMDEQFDLVFIDADKENYCHYYDLVFDKVKPGGYILADNVLWSGKVVGDYEKADRDTKILMDYNRKVHEDPRVENILLPVRDGLMLARKR